MNARTHRRSKTRSAEPSALDVGAGVRRNGRGCVGVYAVVAESTWTPTPQDEAAFKAFLLDGVRECKAFGYTPSLFVRMIQQRGPFEAVRDLLRPGPPSEGFTRLLLAGRLDLCAEAIAHHPNWRAAFTAEELAVAKAPLDQMNYVLPWKD